MVKKFIQGMIIGIANIIPGVSGGTMMVAMGIYDKLIHCITHLFKEFKESMKFLIPIFVGVGIALVVVARILGFCFEVFPIQTNLLFCGLIVGSLPFIAKNVKGKSIRPGMMICCVLFFALVVGMSIMGETQGAAADVSFSLINIIKLFLVGLVAAATMVIPGVSGSMMLMILGYYNTILNVINDAVDALVAFDIPALFRCAGVLIPFGIGVVAGIFVIAKIIEYIFEKAKTHAYWAIIGLIVASPIGILWNTDWSNFSILALLTGIVTFAIGWFAAIKLGE